jgi:hypothetical protein
MKAKNEAEKYIQLGNKQTVVDLENFYVNATMDNLPVIVERKKKEIIRKLEEFQEKYISINYDKNGNELKDVNPYLISMYFFKSINPLSNTEPEYSSEKLGVVWNLYMYLVEQVNMNINPFQPTLTHFAKFAGISLNTLKGYRDNGDPQMRILINKIYDETFDGNMTLAQNNKLNGRSTQFRMKSENEVQEKPQVKVNVNVNENVDIDKINEKLAKYNSFSTKKRKVTEAKYTEIKNG